MEDANRRANEAAESLRRAEEDIRNWRTANPQDFTSAGFLILSAEVTACRAVLAGAQQTLQALAAQSARISAREQRITLHEYLQTIPPLPKYANTLPGPTSTIPPGVRHPQLTLHWGTFEQE